MTTKQALAIVLSMTETGPITKKSAQENGLMWHYREQQLALHIVRKLEEVLR